MKDCNLIQDRNTIAQETVRSVNALEAHLAGAGPPDGPVRKASPGTDCCFHYAPLGMVIIGKDGSFEYINPKFIEMFGYGLDEIPDGRTWFRKAYPDARYRHEVMGAWIRESTEAGMSEPASRIYTVGCKNGDSKTIRFRRVHIGAGRYLMTCEDITDLTEAAEALRNEKAKFEVLAENFPLGVVMIAEDGTYEYINPKFTQMFGYDLNDVGNGKEWFKKAFPDPRYREEAVTAWIDGQRPGEQRPRTFTVTCKDGERKTVHFRPVRLESGHRLITCEDVAECVLRMIYGVDVE